MLGSGIYKITQGSTGKVYVGSSVDIEKRIRAHFSTLKRGSHFNYKMQQAYSGTSETDFVWEVLECCSIGDMIEKENFWIASLNATEEGFNLARLSANTGRTLSKEKKKKLVKASKDAQHIYQFIEDMRKFILYKDMNLPEDVFIGFHDLHLGMNIPIRAAKVGNLLNRMMEEVYTLAAGYYKIHYVCFIKKQATFDISEVKETSSFARKKSSNDIYDSIAHELKCYLNKTKFGSKLSRLLEEEGIILERQDVEKY
jgi:group I intron endonuclease